MRVETIAERMQSDIDHFEINVLPLKPEPPPEALAVAQAVPLLDLAAADLDKSPRQSRQELLTARSSRGRSTGRAASARRGRGVLIARTSPNQQQQQQRDCYSKRPATARPATARPATARPATARPATARPARTIRPATARAVRSAYTRPQTARTRHIQFSADLRLREKALEEQTASKSVEVAARRQQIRLALAERRVQNAALVLATPKVSHSLQAQRRAIQKAADQTLAKVGLSPDRETKLVVPIDDLNRDVHEYDDLNSAAAVEECDQIADRSEEHDAWHKISLLKRRALDLERRYRNCHAVTFTKSQTTSSALIESIPSGR